MGHITTNGIFTWFMYIIIITFSHFVLIKKIFRLTLLSVIEKMERGR